MALLSDFPQLNPATDTFADWLNRTNDISLYLRGQFVAGTTQIMTANSLPGGSMTYGNATLFGQFTANTMVVINDGSNDGTDDNTFANANFGGLRGGVWDNASNTITADTLYIVSNTTYTDESVEVYVNSTYGLIVENNTELRYDVLYVGDGPAGSNTNAQLHWQSSNNQLNFNDDVRATFGGGSGTEVFGGTGQMEMFYSASDNRMYSNTDVQDIRSTANLNLITDRYELRTETGGENMMTANLNGEVVLYWDNAARLTTNSYGVTVHGDAILEDDLIIFDDNKILMGGSSTYDGTQDLTTYKFQMFTDGSDAFIKADDRDLYVEVNEGFELTNIGRATHYMTANATGENEVALFAAGTERLSTIDSASDADNSPDGVEIYGEANTTTLRVQSDANFDGSTGLDSNNISWDASANTLYVRDDTPVVWGDGNDLTIKHDGSHSYITEANTGNLYIEATNLVVRATDGSRYVEGIDGSHVIIYSPDDTPALLANNNQVHITDLANTNTLRVRSTSMFEDDIGIEGSTNANTVTWDKSANTLNFDDNNYITLGTGADLQLYHNGTNSYIDDSGTGNLYIRSNDLNIAKYTGETLIRAIADGSVILYHDNSIKLTTTAIGVNIEGQANTDTLRVQSTTLLEDDVFFDGTSADAMHWESANNLLNFNDNVKATFGTSDDLEIYHNGSHSYIDDSGAGNLYIRTNDLNIQKYTGEEMIRAIADGAVTLFHNNIAKLATTTTGINVTGNLVGDGLLVEGNSDLGTSASHTISMTGVVDTDIVPTGTVDLGTSAAPWTELWVTNADVQTLQVDLNATITGEVTANNFVGDGAQLTALNASQLTTGTVNDARLPATISSDITGTAAQSNTIQMHTSGTSSDFPVVFVSSTSGYQDAVADATFTFNPSTNVLTVDNLIVDTAVTLPSDLTLGGTTQFESIDVSGNLNANVVIGSTFEIPDVGFSGSNTSVSSSSSTVIDSFPVGQTKGFKYFVHGDRSGSSDSAYAVEINVAVTDNGDVYYTRYGEIVNDMANVTLVPSSNATHVNLNATCTSASGSNIHNFTILKIETRS